MISVTKDFAQRDAERAVQATNYGLTWMREIAEQNLNQSKTAMESLLEVTKRTGSGIDHQASAIRKSSMHIAQETLSNLFDFAHKLMSAKDMPGVAQIQADFVSRQAQLVGDQTKELGQVITQGMNVATDVAAETARRSEAA